MKTLHHCAGQHRWQNCGQQRGFTLFELVVVMFIIGITFSFAVISIGDRGRDQVVQQEVQRLAARLTLASQEAVLQAREMALEISKDGYQFVVLEDKGWRVMDGDEILRPHHMPTELRMELNLEGSDVLVDQQEDEETALDDPRVYLLSSGEMTPFELILKDEFGSDYRIIGAANGKVQAGRLLEKEVRR